MGRYERPYRIPAGYDHDLKLSDSDERGAALLRGRGWWQEAPNSWRHPDVPRDRFFCLNLWGALTVNGQMMKKENGE